MVKIEMEVSTKSFLLRLLEKHREEVNKLPIKTRDYYLTQIRVAEDTLNGKVPRVNLGKTTTPVFNFNLGEKG